MHPRSTFDFDFVEMKHKWIKAADSDTTHSKSWRTNQVQDFLYVIMWLSSVCGGQAQWGSPSVHGQETLHATKYTRKSNWGDITMGNQWGNRPLKCWEIAK